MIQFFQILSKNNINNNHLNILELVLIKHNNNIINIDKSHIHIILKHNGEKLD
jgi:hypothetical protein